MSASDSTLMLLLMGLLVPLTGIIMILTPFLMRKNECFTVTVPATALHDGYLRGLKRNYAAIMLVITALLTAATFMLAAVNNDVGTVLLLVVGVLGICLAGYFLMLHYRHKVRLYKAEQHWEARQQESAALIGGESIPQAVSLKWDLLYIPILIITFVIGAVGYANMPDQIPTHAGFDGSVTTYTEKSWFVVFSPVLVQAIIAGSFIFGHWGITRSKRSIDPSAPATSALAYGMFAHAQSLYLVIGGLMLCALLATLPLTFMGIMSLAQMALIVIIGAMVLVFGSIVISLVYGQGGSRVFARMQDSDVILADEDKYWKLGIIYFNPEDPSLFLPKRFGIGWTVNFARPGVWAIMVGGLAIIVAFAIAMIMLF